MRLADLEGGVHEAFFLFLLTTQMHFAIISGAPRAREARAERSTMGNKMW